MPRPAAHALATQSLAAQFLAFACLLLIALLSLVPAPDLPRTGAPGQFEHFLAYAGTALVWLVARRGANRTRIWLGLAAYAGLMELAQVLAPGRHPQIIDFLASAAGAGATVLACGMLLTLAPLARARIRAAS